MSNSSFLILFLLGFFFLISAFYSLLSRILRELRVANDLKRLEMRAKFLEERLLIAKEHLSQQVISKDEFVLETRDILSGLKELRERSKDSNITRWS